MPSVHVILAVLSGTLVGFSLGLVGGGGSMLAVPLLVYVVKVADPHVAIGTTALAVSLNAFANLLLHARAGHVRWSSAAVFATAGTAGAAIGSTAAQWIDGQRLLFLLGLMMLLIAMKTLIGARRRIEPGPPSVRAGQVLAAVGFGTGGVSGFFGIGGGILCVPGLIRATGMSIAEAIGSSLLPVGVFSMTTAVNYAAAGFVDVAIALQFIAGGILGGIAGTYLAGQLATRRGALQSLFALVLAGTAVYILVRASTGMFHWVGAP